MPTAKKHLQVADPIFHGAGAMESKYQVLFDQASDAIVTVRGDGTIDAMNLAAEELTGFMRDELIGAKVQSLVPVVGKSRIPERSRPLSLQHFSQAGMYEDIAVARKDGYVRLVDVSVRIVSQGKESLTIALFRDLTEKKRMERELITKHAELRDAYFQLEKKNTELQTLQETLVQTGKMVALGELATGIAHELNQPLQAIRGYAQEVQSQFKGQGESELKEIISAVDKMSSIIGYLRAFVRKSTEQHEMVNVHHVIEEALKMLSHQFATRGIQVSRDFDPKLPEVYANPLQLEQVFINLSSNARDAIEATERGSGHISIRTRQVGGFVEVEFRDDGCGMSDKTKAKAFNPFFTTKEVGKGMGLGLSLSYGMISKFHGSIVVESEVGKGTVFKIRLPKDFRELA